MLSSSSAFENECETQTPSIVLRVPHLIRWPTTQAVGLVAVQSEHLDSSLDTEVMQDTSHFQRKQIILRGKVKRQLTAKLKVQLRIGAVWTLINTAALAVKADVRWQRSLCESVTAWTEADVVMWVPHFQIQRMTPEHHRWWDTACSNPNRLITFTHSPLSCSAACDRPPFPHQTGFYTGAGQCHPAILG